ncbi:hypothetical protein EDB85DRAFT_1507721 [Lactarius pseudohatsudake]|nr:hypothetical protein EDB85DRAFT_1507721 [Lactarius pseudohatsudake]
MLFWCSVFRRRGLLLCADRTYTMCNSDPVARYGLRDGPTWSTNSLPHCLAARIGRVTRGIGTGSYRDHPELIWCVSHAGPGFAVSYSTMGGGVPFGSVGSVGGGLASRPRFIIRRTCGPVSYDTYGSPHGYDVGRLRVANATVIAIITITTGDTAVVTDTRYFTALR